MRNVSKTVMVVLSVLIQMVSHAQIGLPDVDAGQAFDLEVHAAVANPCSEFNVDRVDVNGTNIVVEMSYYANEEPCLEEGEAGRFTVPVPALPAGGYLVDVALARYGTTNRLTRSFSVPHEADWGEPLWIRGTDGVKPEFFLDGKTGTYIHRQHVDDPDLTYRLETCTNLTDGTWGTLASTPTTNALGGDYHELTHRIALADQQAYVRLAVNGTDYEEPRRLYTYSFGGLEELPVSNAVERIGTLGYAGIAVEARDELSRARMDEYYAISDQMGDDMNVYAAFMAHRFDQYGQRNEI